MGPPASPPLATWASVSTSATEGDGSPADLEGLLWESKETRVVRPLWNVQRGMKIKEVTFLNERKQNKTKTWLVSCWYKIQSHCHEDTIRALDCRWAAEHLNPQGSQVIKTEVWISPQTCWIRISTDVWSYNVCTGPGNLYFSILLSWQSGDWGKCWAGWCLSFCASGDKENLLSSLLTSATRTNDSSVIFYSVYGSAWPLPVPINQRDRLQAATGTSITPL